MWTTTPWTLPSNVALCVNPEESYVKIKADDGFYWLAEALADDLFEKYEVAEKVSGKQLEGKNISPCSTGQGLKTPITSPATDT